MDKQRYLRNRFAILLPILTAIVHIKASLPVTDKESKAQIRNAWFLSVEDGDLENITWMLEYVNVNLRDRQKSTALHIACYKGHEDLAKLLLSWPEIMVNATDIIGRTPLHLAAQQRNIKITALLLKHQNIDVNVLTDDGYSALHWAAGTHNLALTYLLLSAKKIDINMQDLNGKTPLHYAIDANDSTIVSILSKSDKIDLHIKDKKGNTPIMLAKKKNNGHILATLTSAETLYEARALEKRLNLEQWQSDSVQTNSETDDAYSHRLSPITPTSDEAAPHPKVCAFCQSTNCVKRCSKCKSEYYCSSACQKNHWTVHKPFCVQPHKLS